VLLGGLGESMAQLNMTFLGGKNYTNDVSDIWGYVDSLGNEYALVGVRDGISVVDVTDPTNPTEIWWFNGPSTVWRDLKVWNKHCYVTNESSQGLFIIDLSGLPDVTPPATASYTGTNFPFTSAHNIFIDENGVAYILGADYGKGGAIMLDVDTDPMNPTELGVFDTYYLHDGMAQGDTLWGGAINNGFFVAVDVSNKNNPVILGTQNTPSNFTHNCWISDDGKNLYTTDETGGAFLGSYDVSDIGNIKEVDRIQSNPGSGTVVHNTHFMNDYIITSYYRDGVTVHDVTQPDNMIEVANYDTYTAGSGNGFNGAWGVYPWLPSGNVLVSNIEDGLTVHGITYIRGCYLDGTVTDVSTSNPITNATVTILGTAKSVASDLTGGYKSGLATANTYNVRFSAPGYRADTLSAVLMNGVLVTVDAQLLSLVSYTQGGKVTDAGTGNPLGNTQVTISNSDFTFNITTDGAGNFSIPSFFAGTYDVTVGQWGYITDCSNALSINQSTGNLVYALNLGYYDDFSFDFGWTVSGTAATGNWELGEPLGTQFNGGSANPEVDVQGDCSDQAYVTGNTGQGAGDDDVDDGMTRLESPNFDLTTFADPYVEYFQWFFNAGGGSPGNDTLKISISDGTTTVILEEVTAPINQASWVLSKFKITDFVPLSATMKLIIETGDDAGNGHLVEAGLDAFRVFDSVLVSTPEIASNVKAFSAYPNPFSAALEIAYELSQEQMADAVLEVRDITGRTIVSRRLESFKGVVSIDEQLSKGIYTVTLISRGEVLKTLKVVKA